VDPIDAAIAATSDSAYQWVWEVMDDPTDDTFWSRVSSSMHEDGDLIDSPAPKVYENQVRESAYKGAAVKVRFNQGKEPADQTADVEKIYTCYTRPGFLRSASPNGQVLIKRKETPIEVRRRFQSAQSSAHLSARSFHSAIWASAANHQNVTAYDLAIGFGSAVDDPEFRNYLCAVADWRVTKNKTKRPIARWSDFVASFGAFYAKEPDWRKRFIEGNCDYYSTGVLPDGLPLLPEGLPSMIVCETRNGQHIDPTQQATPKAPADKSSPKRSGSKT